MASTSAPPSAVVALDTQDGAMNDNQTEPVVESFDQITVENEWNRLLIRGPQPPPLSKHAAVSVGRKMFVTGGTSPRGTPNDVQVFHAEKLTWQSLGCQSNFKVTRGEQHDPHCPSCTGHSLAFWDKQFVIVGCQTGPASKTVSVLSLDVVSRSWSTLAPKGNAPAARTGHTVVRMASMLVLFGGEDMKGKTLNDIYILDLKTLLWLPLETSGTKPSPRRDHSAAAYSEKYLWIFGGKSRTTYYNDTYCLDFQKMEWTKGRTRGHLPMAQAGHSGVIAGNMWYIVGGEARGDDVRNTLAFDLESQEWSEIANIRPGSPLDNDGISLVKIQNKGKTFLVAFGGHDTSLSNQIYVLLLPSTKQLGSLTTAIPSDTLSPPTALSNSAHSILPDVRDPLSPHSFRRISFGDGAESTPESTFSLGDIDLRSRPSASGFDDQEANLIEDKERILASQDPSTPTKSNDEGAHYDTQKESDGEQQSLPGGENLVQIEEKVLSPVSKLGDSNITRKASFISTSRDFYANTQNGTCEPEVSGDLNERLSAALKLNEDLQNRLQQTLNAKVELEQDLSENMTEADTLKHEVSNLLMAKAEGERKLEESLQKLEELEREVNSPRQLKEDSDSDSQSTSRGEQSIAKPNSLHTLFEESSDDPATRFETQRRLEEVEIKLTALTNSQRLIESSLMTTTREKRELSVKATTAVQIMEEARTACKTLRAENLRLGHELLAVKAQLTDIQEELQTKQVELAQASVQNFDIQLEMHELSRKFSGS